MLTDILQTQLTWESIHLRDLWQKPQWTVYYLAALAKQTNNSEKEQVPLGNYALFNTNLYEQEIQLKGNTFVNESNEI